jgi:hypothetical protein
MSAIFTKIGRSVPGVKPKCPFEPGPRSAQSFILFAVIFAVALFQVLPMNRKLTYQAVRGRSPGAPSRREPAFAEVSDE